MIYWRLLLLAIFVTMVCLLNMPHQVMQIEYSLAHNRTRVLERQMLEAVKTEAAEKKKPYSEKYLACLDDLGWIYYQLSRVTEAEAYFLRELEVSKQHKTSGYDASYARSLVSVATYYRERANYEKAIEYYNQLRDYDLLYTRIPDLRRARDLGNLGLTCYLWGETFAEADRRAIMFSQAESYCKTALAEYERIPGTERAQGDVLATEALTLRDLGMQDKAEESSRKSRAILAAADNKAVEP